MFWLRLNGDCYEADEQRYKDWESGRWLQHSCKSQLIPASVHIKDQTKPLVFHELDLLYLLREAMNNETALKLGRSFVAFDQHRHNLKDVVATLRGRLTIPLIGATVADKMGFLVDLASGDAAKSALEIAYKLGKDAVLVTEWRDLDLASVKLMLVNGTCMDTTDKLIEDLKAFGIESEIAESGVDCIEALKGLDFDRLEEEQFKLTETEHVDVLLETLGVTKEALADILTTKSIKLVNGAAKKPLTFGESLQMRHAFIKLVTMKLIEHTIASVNSKLDAKDTDGNNSIKILDLPHQGNSEHNSYEQMMLNYLNEKVHVTILKRLVTEPRSQQLSHTVFSRASSLEPIEYVRRVEKNLQLFDSSKLNIFHHLEDEIKTELNDSRFTTALHTKFAQFKTMPETLAKITFRRDEGFVVRHYDGALTVCYESKDFAEKYNDSFEIYVMENLQQYYNQSDLMKLLFPYGIHHNDVAEKRAPKRAESGRLRLRREVQHVTKMLEKENVVPVFFIMNDSESFLCDKVLEQIRFHKLLDVAQQAQLGFNSMIPVEKIITCFQGLLDKERSWDMLNPSSMCAAWLLHFGINSYRFSISADYQVLFVRFESYEEETRLNEALGSSLETNNLESLLYRVKWSNYIHSIRVIIRCVRMLQGKRTRSTGTALTMSKYYSKSTIHSTGELAEINDEQSEYYSPEATETELQADEQDQTVKQSATKSSMHDDSAEQQQSEHEEEPTVVNLEEAEDQNRMSIAFSIDDRGQFVKDTLKIIEEQHKPAFELRAVIAKAENASVDVSCVAVPYSKIGEWTAFEFAFIPSLQSWYLSRQINFKHDNVERVMTNVSLGVSLLRAEESKKHAIISKTIQDIQSARVKLQAQDSNLDNLSVLVEMDLAEQISQATFETAWNTAV